MKGRYEFAGCSNTLLMSYSMLPANEKRRTNSNLSIAMYSRVVEGSLR